MQITIRQISIFALLALLMAGTRYNHFGSSVALPDASLAVFLLAGFYLPRMRWPALLAFIFLVLEAAGIDCYAIAVKGVSDWCVSPAYVFLIPTYAVMMLAGRWFAARRQKSWGSLAVFAMVSLVSTSLAFLLSNASFYLFSGRFQDMSMSEYAARVAQYYPPYVSNALLYLAIAALVHIVLASPKQSAAVQH